MAIPLPEDSRVLVLTGAGVSAESGIPTFRGLGGLWERYSMEELATPEAFQADPKLVWRFYSERRKGVLEAQPNEGHHALVRLEADLGDRFLLLTQNVDGLHRRAGSRRVIEMHGALLKSRCSRCERGAFDDESLYLDELPICELCADRGERGLLRPHVVWFGEALDPRELEAVEDFMRGPGELLFVAVGTSGYVYPAAGLVAAARTLGARTLLVNLEEADNESLFAEVKRGASAEVLPDLVDQWIRH